MMMSPTAAKVNGCAIFIASSLDGSCRTCSTAPCDAPCPWSNTRDATRPVTIIAMTAKLVVFVMNRVFIGNSSSCRAQIFVTTITYKVRPHVVANLGALEGALSHYSLQCQRERVIDRKYLHLLRALGRIEANLSRFASYPSA